MMFRCLLLLAGLACCRLQAADVAAPPAAAGATYELHGVLQSYDAARHEALVSHQAIPGFMPAMTMPFDVHEPTAWIALAPGDSLVCQLHVSSETSWLDGLHKIDAPPAPSFAPALPSPVRELKPGDYLEDAALPMINERGEKVTLRDFRGQVLAITFIYLRCPLPNYCPLMNRNFETAQELLTRMLPAEKWHLLSVSLDPANDTPAGLSAAATNYHAEPARWNFLIAPEGEVRALGSSVGLEFNDANGWISHNLRTMVLDPAGRLRHVFAGNNWTPQELVAAMRSALVPALADAHAKP